MDTPRTLLERYVQAKDDVRPELMRSIYRPDALLTYTIDTDDIRFPARTEGLDEITRTLVIDFASRFSNCKTYYVCAAPPPDTTALVRIPWLVVMREPAARSLRIGKGFYEWRFRQEPALRVQAMHIHIHRMDAQTDPRSELLAAAQAQLDYPWLAASVLRSTYEARSAQHAELAFLRDFAEPVATE
jgi:hypothetical protein